MTEIILNKTDYESPEVEIVLFQPCDSVTIDESEQQAPGNNLPWGPLVPGG